MVTDQQLFDFCLAFSSTLWKQSIQSNHKGLHQAPALVGTRGLRLHPQLHCVVALAQGECIPGVCLGYPDYSNDQTVQDSCQPTKWLGYILYWL